MARRLAVPTFYEEQLEGFREALAAGVRPGESETAEPMRDLVETVTIFRDLSKPVV